MRRMNIDLLAGDQDFQQKGTSSFKKKERIHRRGDFLRILPMGKKFQTDHFQIRITPNRLVYSRLGISVGKRVGTAVQRNRVKRRVREYFRLNKGFLLESSDFVVIAKEGAADLKFCQISQELKKILREH